MVIASLVTTDQSTVSVSFFLHSFLHDEQRIYGHNGVKNPLLIMIDGSAMLLLAVLFCFTGEFVENYFMRCYRVVTGGAQAKDLNKLFVHQCASHFIKNASRKCRKLYRANFHEGMYWIGILLKSTNIEEIDSIIYLLAILLLSEKSNDDVFDSYQKMQEKIGMKETYLNLITHDDQDPEDNELDNENDTDMSQAVFIEKLENSPFKNRFQKIVNKAIEHIRKSKSSEQEENLLPNAYRSTAFMEYLLNYAFPSIANWSGLLLGDLGRHGTGEPYTQYTDMFKSLKKSKHQNISSNNRTQGIIEKSMGEVKRVKLQYERCSKLHVLVSIFQNDLLPLHREFAESFCKARNKKSKSQKLASEKWLKRVRRPGKEGKYLTPPTKKMKFKEGSCEQKKQVSTQQFPQTSTPILRKDNNKQRNKITTTKNKSDYRPLFPLGRGISNNSYSCWWIASIQALLPLYLQLRGTASQIPNLNEFKRSLMFIFDQLKDEIGHSVPFHSVKKSIGLCASFLSVSVQRQQDAAEFLTCDEVCTFFHDAGLSPRFVLQKTSRCALCDRASTVDTTKSTVLTIPATNSRLDNNINSFFRCVRLPDELCTHCVNIGVKTVTTKILHAPSVLLIQLMRFRWRDSRAEKVTTTIQVPDTVDLTQMCMTKNEPTKYRLISVVVHVGGTVEGGHYVTYVNDRSYKRKLLFDDHIVRQVTDEEYSKAVDEGAYILIYQKHNNSSEGHTKTQYRLSPITAESSDLRGDPNFFYNFDDSYISTNEEDPFDQSNTFTVNKNEKIFVENVWGYIDESLINKQAVKLKSSNEILTFAHIAMLNVHIPAAVYQSFIKLSPNFNRGWISDFFVDFYTQQLAESEEVSQTCAALLCCETSAILTGDVTAATYRSVQRKCFVSGHWCDIILCPFLRNSHFRLLVIDKIKRSVCCYDSMSPFSEPLLRQIAKCFGFFFHYGKKSKYWGVLPTFIRSSNEVDRIFVSDKSLNYYPR